MKKLVLLSFLIVLFAFPIFSQDDCPPDLYPTLKGQIVKYWLNESSMSDLYFRNQYGGPWLSRNEYTAIVRTAVSYTMAAWGSPSGVQMVEGTYEDQ